MNEQQQAELEAKLRRQNDRYRHAQPTGEHFARAEEACARQYEALKAGEQEFSAFLDGILRRYR